MQRLWILQSDSLFTLNRAYSEVNQRLAIREMCFGQPCITTQCIGLPAPGTLQHVVDQTGPRPPRRLRAAVPPFEVLFRGGRCALPRPACALPCALMVSYIFAMLSSKQCLQVSQCLGVGDITFEPVHHPSLCLWHVHMLYTFDFHSETFRLFHVHIFHVCFVGFHNSPFGTMDPMIIVVMFLVFIVLQISCLD